MVWRLLFGCCLSLILVSCAEQTPTQPTSTTFGDLSAITAGTGQADLFSGLPNPQWPLDAEDIEHIQQVLQTATPTTNRPESPGLSYRGMNVELVGDSLSIQLSIYAEVITLRQAGTTFYLNDPNQAFERWLLERARPKLEPAIYDLIKKNLP